MSDNFSRRALFVGALVILMSLAFFGRGSIYPAHAEPSQATATYCVFLPIVLGVDSGTNAAEASEDVDCIFEPVEPVIVDFNGDGYSDLAIGIPQEDFSLAVQNSGAVQVVYGTADGLSSANAQYWTENAAGEFSEAGELFGTSVSAADFNDDSYTDLAIGAPGEWIDGKFSAGQVTVLYGSATGLVADGSQTFSQGIDGIQGVPEEEDRFGDTMTSGDYNGDGYADLIVGAPMEDYEAESVANMGAINIIYGSEDGLGTNGNDIIHQAQSEVDGTPSWWGRFGYALETGDFDGDGMDDVAVGIPGYDLVTTNDVGSVEVFYGSASGVSVLGEQLWRQGIDGVSGAVEAEDYFGASLAAGDFDNNGADDLAIGVPNEDVLFNATTYTDAGAIHILYGYALVDGLTATGSQLWHQGLAEINANPHDFNYFGIALVAADFNGDAADDLAVGASGQTIAESAQGMVQVFYSNGSILSTVGQDLWVQEMVGGVAEAFDFFGTDLGTADFNGDSYADLAVGVSFEDIEVEGVNREDAGEVDIIYGEANGLSAVNSQLWQQGEMGIAGTPDEDDRFGFALTR